MTYLKKLKKKLSNNSQFKAKHMKKEAKKIVKEITHYLLGNIRQA